MIVPDAARELARLIEEASGNVVPPGHFPFLVEVAARRAAACGLPDLESYVTALARGALAEEWRSLLPRVTIKESYLFRTPQHFDAISAVVIPQLVRARAATRRLRVWSAGCARGEEPATLATVFAEHEALAGWDWQIDATDVDEEALALARRARFGERAVAHVPPLLLARYFERRGDSYELAAPLASRIVYRPLNLVREPFPVPAEPYDLVLLRNVLIYFRAASQQRVASGVAAALAVDGFLFLGPSETLWQVSDAFEPLDLGECFCYRPVTRAPAPRRPAARPAPAEGVVRPAAPGTTRPRQLPPEACRQPPVVSPLPPPRQPDAEAAFPAGSRERLLTAGARLAENRSDEAARLIAEVLRDDPSDADAHALDGFIHDVEGRAQQAIASYRAALFLDPGLFQVRTLLAECLRRLGWHERAAHEYREVLALLQRNRGRDLELMAGLPLPTREQAARRCRDGLRHVPH